MAALARPLRADLLDILKDQVAFLVASSKAFDSGFEHEALRLAVTLRVLMHETSASHSLLGQMGLRESMLYFDTAFPYSKTNLLPESALTTMELATGAAETRGRYLPSLSRPPVPDRWAGFRRWWQINPVIRDSRGEVFTRHDLVLYAANEEGGAHVQAELTPRYEAMSRANSLGYELGERGVSFHFGTAPAPIAIVKFDWDNGPALPSVRMVAHEMLVSIQRFAPDAMAGVVVRERAENPAERSSVWASSEQ